MTTPLTLRIGRDAYTVRTIEDAQRLYCDLRDKSGEGASTFPSGRLGALRISYNGRAWNGDRLVAEKPAPLNLIAEVR